MLPHFHSSVIFIDAYAATRRFAHTRSVITLFNPYIPNSAFALSEKRIS